MPANDEDFFGMLPPANFADHIGGLHWAMGEGILHVKADTRGHATFQKTLQLPLVFRRHGNNRHREIGVKAENPCVRQVHARGFSSALATNHRDGARRASGFEEIAEHGEETHLVFGGLAFCCDQHDFPFEPRDVLDFVLDVEHVDGHHVAFGATCGRRTGPAHRVNV